MGSTSGGISGRRRWSWTRSVATLLLCGPFALPLFAQEANDLPAADVVAEFRRARRVAVDPLGNIYVVDRGAASLVRLTANGTIETLDTRSHGIDPTDVDPTNGLVLFVTDRSGRRMVRFSRNLALIGFIGGFRSEAAVGRVSAGAGMDIAFEPEAIEVGPEGEVFVTDALRRDVIKLDPLYRFERRVGGFGSGGGELADPIDLAVTPRGELAVLDAGREALLMYDGAGGFLRRVELPDGPTPSAILARAELLVLVRADRIDVLREDEWETHCLPADAGGPLVDAAFAGDRLYLLTPRQLLVAPSPF